MPRSRSPFIRFLRECFSPFSSANIFQLVGIPTYTRALFAFRWNRKFARPRPLVFEIFDMFADFPHTIECQGLEGRLLNFLTPSHPIRISGPHFEPFSLAGWLNVDDGEGYNYNILARVRGSVFNMISSLEPAVYV